MGSDGGEKLLAITEIPQSRSLKFLTPWGHPLGPNTRCRVGPLSMLLIGIHWQLWRGALPLMLVQEECVEVHALKRRGWSISAIARHLGRDRKTVRAYLLGERMPGERARIGSDPFDRFEPYVRQRLADDPHVWASALFDEIAALGYPQSYPTFVRKIRHRGLRPSCGACAGTRGA